MTQKTEIDFLNDKIQILEQQITNIKNERFQHELTVMDSAAQMKDTKAATQLRVQSSNAKSLIIICDRRLEVREKMLEKLVKEVEEKSNEIGEQTRTEEDSIIEEISESVAAVEEAKE